MLKWPANFFLTECHWPAVISSLFAIIFVSSFISCFLLHLYLYPDPLARRANMFRHPLIFTIFKYDSDYYFTTSLVLYTPAAGLVSFATWS